MSFKNTIDVVIDGQVFTLVGYESEEYLQKVAGYINGKITEYKKNELYRRQKIDTRRTLIEINIADDYFKAKKQADMLENDLEAKDKQLYDVKHDLISANVRIEALEKEVEQLNQKIIEYQKDIIRYQTELKNS